MHGENTSILEMGHVKAALACTSVHLNGIKISKNKEAKKYHDQAVSIYTKNGEAGKFYKEKHFENWDALKNFKGQSLGSHEQESYWYEYSKKAIDKLLELRLESAGVDKGVEIVSPDYVFDGSTRSAEKLSKEIISKEAEQIFVILNLYYEHWVGIIIVDKANAEINVHYLDSEQCKIPIVLKEKLVEILNVANPESQVNIIEEIVEQQKYNNCGLEVIENFIQYLTNYRLSQEDVLPVHTLLYEDSIMLTGNINMG